MKAPRHEMLVEKDVPIPMDDGLELLANVFRPKGEGRFPVVMAQGVYGKDIHFADGFTAQWDKLIAIYPELCSDGSTGRYLRWETTDPERWVPEGYVVIQVDSRGSGKSPGYLDPRSPREAQDYYQAIEWAGTQPWSNGRVGLLGISYYAFTQWTVAALQPPHLAAIIPWEGLTDYYRDSTHHGGIFANSFAEGWWPRQVTVNQHGNGTTRYRDRDTGAPPTGTPLSEAMLAGNRADYLRDLHRHILDDQWFQERSPALDRVVVPMLSAGNWGGPGVHLRGNIEGFMRAASPQKWLSMHIGTHWDSFYLPDYVALQKRFFSHFLKGEANGWDREAPVQMAVRQVDGTAIHREAVAFPLPGTEYRRYQLDAGSMTLADIEPGAASEVSYDAAGEGVHFTTAPFTAEVEFTGFVTLRLWVASTTDDMDVFAVIRLLDPAGKEVIFIGAHEPTPVARGWLRASHRKIDEQRSLPYRVFHAHDEVQPMTPGAFYCVDVEIWPTCLVMRPGYRLMLTLMGKDFEFPGTPGRILHTHPIDRPPAQHEAHYTIATGGERQSYLVLPVITLGSAAEQARGRRRAANYGTYLTPRRRTEVSSWEVSSE